MKKIDTLNNLNHSNIPESLKQYLQNKVQGFLEEYTCNDFGDIFSIILLRQNELDYISDKLLEFAEILQIGNQKWIHTVWAPSDGYSEDIYLPYSAQAMEAIERRC
ncbi:hypothetical protein [Ruminococcus sp.]|uniref:hypothetical protein n=1 Tax=Ruminococcus sp. TaxID=41978 RepID=UPI0025E64723|nr:hypothetical protein [Ruminococcus sp.]